MLVVCSIRGKRSRLVSFYTKNMLLNRISFKLYINPKATKFFQRSKHFELTQSVCSINKLFPWWSAWIFAISSLWYDYEMESEKSGRFFLIDSCWNRFEKEISLPMLYKPYWSNVILQSEIYIRNIYLWNFRFVFFVIGKC